MAISNWDNLLNNIFNHFYIKTFFALSTGIFACSLAFAPRANAQNCNAGFGYNVVDTAPFIVQFIDSSWYPDNSNNHLWLYGDGSPLSDTNIANPVHTFPQYGTYNVCLFIYDSNWAFCDTSCLQVPTGNPPPPACNAYFWFYRQLFTLSFTDYSSNAVSWSWDFGDGNTSSVKNPVHTYANEGYYSVCLTIADTGACTDNYCAWVWVGCFQDTSFYYSANGTTVQFYQYLGDSSSSSMIYSWDFGDGNFSLQSNPIHTYATFGNYNVCLYIQDTSGTCADTFCRTITANCLDASFYTDQNYQQKYSVAFYDVSGGNVVSWLWDFGDGTVDSVANPVHTYPAYGYFNVCLTVTSSDSCTDQYCSYIYLQCCELDIDYSYTGTAVNFNPYSLSCAWFYSYLWDFGDGVTAIQNNYDTLPIQHVYAVPGIYTVCLSSQQDTFYYQGCRDSICKNIVVLVGDTCADLSADFGGWGIRPQIQTYFTIHYCNYGNTQADNTMLSVNLNSLIIPDSANPAWSSQTGNTLTWTPGSVAAGQCGDIYLVVTGDVAAQVGSVLCSDLQISSSADECDSADNVVQGCFNVVNSFDPNDKRLEAKNFAQKGYVDADTVLPSGVLNYMIRFQNTGTAPAINIFVYDTLDSHLDPATVIAGASSHSYTYFEIIGNVVKWSFLNINLADSNINEPASHGFVKLSVRQKPGNVLGTVIPNSSGIIFDFNIPVITNKAIVIIDSLTPVIDFKNTMSLNSYPNPVVDVLLLMLPENFGAVRCEIADVTGRKVYVMEGNHSVSPDKKISLSLGNLAPGIYHIWVTGEGGERVSAVVVKQ